MSKQASSPKIDYEEVNKIIQLMEEKNLTRFELEVEGFRVNISRNIPSSPRSAPVSADHSHTYQENGEYVPQESFFEEKKDNLHYITSPMVGTFYHAPDPSSPPFVEVGDEIKKNQVLCIIEAMKLMNEIESDIDGVVKEIFIENGKSIEYGQKIFGIQPSK